MPLRSVLPALRGAPPSTERGLAVLEDERLLHLAMTQVGVQSAPFRFG